MCRKNMRYEELLTPNVSDVVVVGGCKSACEALSLCLEGGKHVHWVVREGDVGAPLIVADPDARKMNIVALGNTRLFGALSPSVFDTESFLYWFFHSGFWLGALMLRLFWWVASAAIKAPAGYESSVNGRAIKPRERNFLWLSSYISLVYKGGAFLSNLHDTSRLTVHRAHPIRLSKRAMQLSNGTTICSPSPSRKLAVVYCTGWSSTVAPLFSPADALALGLLHSSSTSESPPASHYWSDLTATAHTSLSQLLPNCLNPLLPSPPPRETNMLRLYRFAIPPSQLYSSSPPNIAFISHLSTSQTTTAGELLALWSIAHLSSLVPASSLPPDLPSCESHVALVNAWMSRWYGHHANLEVILETQSFFDEVLRDLGVECRRKWVKGGRTWWAWVREWVEPYRCSDYEGVVEEFLQVVEERRRKGEGKKER
ncbi:MAG: hypothetical protein Q9227_005276 [Pyrenula ochraceoflavens]